MPAELVYLSQGEWVSYPLDKDDISIGRDALNDVVVENRSVSRRHARLSRNDDGWRVVDLGSRYGTLINDHDAADRLLRDGDTIYLHRFPLSFVDRETARATLTPRTEQSGPMPMTTVYQSAVDFHALASRGPDVDRLQRLLGVVTWASEAILVGESLEATFHQVLDLVFEHLPVERGFVMLWDEQKQDLVSKAVKQKNAPAGSVPRIQFSRTIAEKVFREKIAVLTTDAQTDGRFASGASILELGIRSAMAAPVWRGERVDGLIYADTSLLTKAFDSFDLDLLSALGNHLAVAIEQHRLQQSVLEHQIMRRRLERYHSPAVVERITHGLQSPQGIVAEEREVTVLFADVVAFTDRCETLEPRAVADFLNHFFGEMTEVVFRHEGTLDKFIGDCLMAVFGAPIAMDDHARRAASAACDMREALAGLNEVLPESQRVSFRVAMNSGRVVAGDIGSRRRSDFTVLGTTVNLAARLESSVALPGEIVISDATRQLLGDAFHVRPLGEKQFKGISRPVGCFELVGRAVG